MKKTVTVVIPLYNKRLYILRALKSVLFQTYPPDEIIVINDGSTDGGEKVVQSLYNEKVKLITQENAGVSAARNRGIDEASSELIAFLDADDEWHSDYIVTIHGLVSIFPRAGLYTTAYEYYSKQKKKRNIANKYFLKDSITVFENPFHCFLGEPLFCTDSVVVPKNIFLELGGFPIGVKHREDIETWLKIGLNYPIVYSSKKAVNYRRDTELNTSNTKMVAEDLRFFDILNIWFNEGKIRNELIHDYFLFVCYKKMEIAKGLIRRGEPHKARRLLSTSLPKSKLLVQWLSLYFASYLSFLIRSS